MNTKIILFVFALYLCLSQVLATPLQEEQFQQAIHLMETRGDYRNAITMFEAITTGPDRKLAARSLFYVGVCYEALGRDEAQKAYRQVIEEYREQSEIAAEAQARLAALTDSKTSNDGTDIVTRRVWKEADVLGSLSPDGRYLSFVDWVTGDLAIRELATGENRRLTNKGTWNESYEFAEFSIFSPDGQHVVYAWYNKDNFYDLRSIGLAGSEPRILYENDELTYIVPYEWCPDGEQILALFSKADRTNQIVLISVADGSVRGLKTFDWRSPAMSLSPDGRYIAYDFPQQEKSPERDVFLLATDGSRAIPLIQNPADDQLLGWLPDGKRILFASNRTGTIDVWSIQVDEGKSHEIPELIKTDMGQIVPIGLTRQGSFYYGIEIGKSDIYIAKLDLMTGKIIEQPIKATQRFVGWNTSADWSPDGQYLAYISMRNPNLTAREIGGRIVSIRSLETGDERHFIPKLNYFNPWTRLGWSPDGRSFILPGSDSKSRGGIYQIDAESGEATAIVQSETDVHLVSPICSHDGKTIFYIRTTDKMQSIQCRDLKTGVEKELFRTSQPYHIRGLDISIDSRLLAFIVDDQATRSEVLKIIPTDDGKSRDLLKLLNPEGFGGVHWTRGESQLLFKKYGSEKIELWRIHVKSGETQKMDLIMDSMRGFRVHPDNQRIVFNTGFRTHEVWVMENFLSELITAKGD